MAVPASGELKLVNIYNEVDADDYNGVNSAPTNLSLTGVHAGTYGTINTSSSSNVLETTTSFSRATLD